MCPAMPSQIMHNNRWIKNASIVARSNAVEKSIVSYAIDINAVRVS